MQIAGKENMIGSSSSDREIFDKILNFSRSMITIINRDYVYESVNDTFCREHKVVREDIVGKSLSDFWGDETFEKYIKGRVDTCFAGETITYEACFDTPHHGKRFFEVAFRPVRSDNNGVTHIISETFDINELRISRREALEKEAELRNFETNLPIGFVRCLPDGNILSANTVFLRILDYPDNTDVLDLNMKIFYPAEILFNIHLDQLVESLTKNFGRVFLKNRQGEEIPCRLSGFMAKDDLGNLSYIDFAVEDASRELMLENRLVQAQKMETIGALAGGIAHDFNNILATISGYSEMMQDDLPRESPLSENVSRIQGAVLKAQSIIKQMLAFSRQMEQEKIQVDPGEVLEETLGFISSSIPHNIYLESRISEHNQMVLADPTQLFRVFLNLMTNAVQAMEGKGGTITVTLEIVEGRQAKNHLSKNIVADEYILITFRDTGKGMESTVIERIFEPFFTTREVGKGIGLGLSVIHGIVTEIEGEVVVSSRKEEGSVFSVYLPVARELAETPGPALKRKILFITGDQHESRILSMALEKSGYDLIYITQRRNLIQTLGSSSSQPDLIIIMDESLQVQPEEFISVYSQLKISTPCLLISEGNHGLIAEKLLNSGIIIQHLIKPVSLKEIRNGIQLALG